MSRSLRILLWSPGGSGTHWDGPGLAARRLYSRRPFSDDVIDLVHGSPLQDDPMSPYRRVVSMGRHDRADRLLRYLVRSDVWLRRTGHRYDVVHGVNAFETTVRPLARAQALGIPTVLKVAQHDFDLADKSGLSTRLGLPAQRRAACRRLSAIVAISSEIEQELLDIGVGQDAIHRIPNGVDVDEYRPASDTERSAARRTLGWPERPTVICVGALIPRKRQHLLVDAVASVSNHEVQLVLAGPQPDPAYLRSVERAIAAHDLRERVILEPHREDPSIWYAAADIFALLSANEGMANVLLEAMASGLPIVSTRTSGVSDLLGGTRFGTVLDNATPSEAGAAIAAYLNEPRRASTHGTAARQRTERCFSLDAVAERHRELLLDVTAPRDRP